LEGETIEGESAIDVNLRPEGGMSRYRRPCWERFFLGFACEMENETAYEGQSSRPETEAGRFKHLLRVFDD
jgi:hypothetical protein